MPRDITRYATCIIERGGIYNEDVKAVLGPRPWKSHTDMTLEIKRKRQLKDLTKSDEPEEKDSDTNKPASQDSGDSKPQGSPAGALPARQR